MVIGVTTLVFISGYVLTKLISRDKGNSDIKQQIIGTWTTEDGTEKLIISNKSLIYIDKSVDIKDTCTYVMKQFDDEEIEFILYPTKDNKKGILGAFEEIKYSDEQLVGSILIHDIGVHTTEFRKDW